MRKQSIFIIFAIILTSCNSLAVNAQSPSPSTTDNSTQAPSTGIEATWKTYTNAEVGFSIQYPSNWQEETVPNENPNMHNIDLKGPEGEVELEWGTGFGGACPGGYQPMEI